MSTARSISYDTVLEVVSGWPSEKRLSLVQDVLETLAPESRGPRSQRRTLERALGLLPTGQPAPSDADVRQWLDEHRMEKYG
jgi:hypothetical protein